MTSRQATRKASWFSNLLTRLLGPQKIHHKDRQVIRLFPERSRSTHELPLPRKNQTVSTIEEFVHGGHINAEGQAVPMPIGHDGRSMIQEMGWSEWPYNVRVLGEGFFGIVHLVYWSNDINHPLEKRHFAALKVQKLTQYNVDNIWQEIVVLRSVKHEHIIDYYGCFLVAPETGEIRRKNLVMDPLPQAATQRDSPKKKLTPAQPDNWRKPAKSESKQEDPVDEVWMLLEFADAADLHTEILRYDNMCIPEPGARYYMRQICDGLEYLHSKDISHNDLHYHNVLLKYRSDGRSKSCLICDFGLAQIAGSETFKDDVKDAAEILFNMLTGVPNHVPLVEPVLSNEARSLLTQFAQEDHPATVKRMRRHAWFKRSEAAPVPDHTSSAGSDGTIVMDYVNPDPPPRKLDAKSRWPTPGRGRPGSMSQHDPPMSPIPEHVSPGKQATGSRARSGSGRGRRLPVSEEGASGGATGGQSFGSWFRNLGKKRSTYE